MKRLRVSKWLSFGALLGSLLLLVPMTSSASDTYYFHDSGNNGLWDNFWNPGAAWNCSFPGEYMDCSAPTGLECLRTPVKGGLAGGPLCWLDLPGCAPGAYPAGTWTANLWLVATEADSILVKLYVVPCNNICPDQPQFIASGVGAVQADSLCTQIPISIPAPAFALTDSTRLMLEIYSSKWGAVGKQVTWLCWNSTACPSNLQSTAQVFCPPVGTEKASWGRLKSIYR